jgi:hypothetical protein
VCLNYTTPTILDIPGIYFKQNNKSRSKSFVCFLFVLIFQMNVYTI